ncbi:MAG: hypothetical protein GX247_04060 [Mollicutes bacterium]|nr:hypothetical protein [Mollicutes bacterium]
MDNKQNKKDEKKITNKEVKGKKTKSTGTPKSKVAIIALITAFGIFVTSVVVGILQHFKNKTKTGPLNQPKITDELEDEKELNPNLSFDPNSNKEMINRIAHIYTNALSKGVNNISIEQWIDFYLVLNIDNIEVTDYARLKSYIKTKDSMMRNFDYVVNILLNDAITSEPSTIIDITSLIANKKSADAVYNLQNMIASFNISSNKSEEASKINKFVENEFSTSDYKQIEASSNLVRMKLLKAMEDLTINQKYRIPTADMSKIIFGDSKRCDEDTMNNSIYNFEKTYVKQTLDDKLNKALNIKIDDAVVEAEELLTELQIRNEIEKIIKDTKVEYVPNPDMKKAIDAHKPKDTVQTVKPTDKIVKDPNTGKNVIVIELTEEEKKKQQEEIQRQIEEENRKEEERVKTLIEEAQKENKNTQTQESTKIIIDKNKNQKLNLSKKELLMIDAYNYINEIYDRQGYYDGYYGKPRNDSYKVDSKNEDYKKYCNMMWAEKYNPDYDQGEWDRGVVDAKKDATKNATFDRKNNRKFIPEPVGEIPGSENYRGGYYSAYEPQYTEVYYAKPVKENKVKNKNENKNQDKKESKTKTEIINKTEENNQDDIIINKEFIPLPEYFYDKDGNLTDEHNSEIEIIINQLLLQKQIAMNMQKMNKGFQKVIKL